MGTEKRVRGWTAVRQKRFDLDHQQVLGLLLAFRLCDAITGGVRES